MELVIATHNKGKVAEFARLFEKWDVLVFPMDALGLHIEIEETGKTFAENARIKAETIFSLTGKAVIADDSGLCVDALNGAPGVYSARYGTPDLDDRGRLELLLKNMENVPDAERAAHFACAICFMSPGATIEALGTCPGSILRNPKGSNGFGYDPIFMPDRYREMGLSFAELSPEQKNEISHRGNALQQLCSQLAEKNVFRTK